MSHTTDEEMPSSSPPGVMSKRNQLSKIVSQKFNTDFTEEMLACDIDLDKFDESELQLIVGDMKMEYDANGDGIIDDQELNKIIRDAFVLGLKNKGLKNDNAVLEKKVDNMSKHVKRNQMMSSVIIVLVMIVTFVSTYFGTKASFDQGTVELKNSITESITTSVGVDTPDGRPHLQDSETGVDVSTRSYGDAINARNLVAVDGSLVRCLSTEEVAQLAEDVQHGADVRLSFVDPTTDLATETYAVSMGDFHDENSYLSFGSDKVRIMLDSDICNQAVAAEEVSSDVVSVEEPDVDAEPDLEEEVEEDDIKLNIELALESAVNGIDSDDSIFDRNLRRQQPEVESVKDDILKRHRDAYAEHRSAIQSGRQMRNLQISFMPVFNFNCGGPGEDCCGGTYCQDGLSCSGSGTCALPTLDLGDRNVWERAFYIREYFYNLQGSGTFSDSSTPQARALSFVIQTESPIPENGAASPSYDQLEQRYVLAVIYYSLNGENWPIRHYSQSQLWVNTESLNECTKYGITCNSNGAITKVDLEHQSWVSLKGTIPSEIGMLASLRELKLAGASMASINTNNPDRLYTLSGTIPTTLGTLSNLRVLELTGSHYLEYEGGQYCYGCSYEQFFVGLTGTIPNQLGNLSNLRVLKLNSNELTGTIPATLGQYWIHMERLDLSYNDLTGTIPSNLNGNQDWRDSNLLNLYLNNNRFTGTMPEEICALRRTISTDYMNYVADHGEHIGVMNELGADCSALSCGSQELHHSEPGAYPVSCCNCCSEESHCG